MDKNHWIFISPHFDDVALSCGGLVWNLVQQGHTIEVWTIFGGFPPDQRFSEFAEENHAAWGKSGEQAIRMRMGEDHAACSRLGAITRHFPWPDAIYRRDPQTGAPWVNNNEDLFGKPVEEPLVTAITQMLQGEIPQDAILVLPISLGNHIDHRAVAAAGEHSGRVNYYYADYPYILWHFENPILHDGSLVNCRQILDQDALEAWQGAVLCYASQLSGFWRDEQEAQLGLENYLAGGGGRLWVKNSE